MKAPKIHLSAAETELMKDAAIILTKNTVLEKVRGLLLCVQEAQLEWAAAHPHEIFSVPPKISRGENYLGLPWLVLDFPRRSGPEGIFFIRSFFWWGRFFSSTLHLSGAWAARYGAAVSRHHDRLEGFSAGVNADPWVHHFGPDNYRPLTEWTDDGFAQWCAGADTIKIARAFSLDEWSGAVEILEARWRQLLGACGLVA